METLKFDPPTFLQKAQAVISNPVSPFTALLRPLPQRRPDDLGLILYTSGTSGVPKGVMLTNRNLESNAQDAMVHARFTERTIFLGILPLFHTFGLMATGFVPFALGCKVIYRARFSAPAVFEAIEKYKTECIFAVPTMYAVLLNAKSGDADALKSVKLAISGGEPLRFRVPAGIRSGEAIRLEGLGNTDSKGNKGDRLLVIELTAETGLSLDGLDIIVDREITPWDAALGTTIKLAPLKEEISIKVKPDTRSGMRLRVRAHGYRDRDGRRGDLYVSLTVQNPSSLPEEIREAYEKAQRLHS